MPASLRAHVSRGTASSRPYDRPSPTASPAQSENHLSRSLPPASSIQDPNPNPEREQDSPPDHPGLPTYANYKRIEAEYLHSLSPRKRDKALITQAMFDKIWDVLHQPEACTVETPQFRFWVRKMFTLSRPVCVGGGGWGVVRVDGTGVGTGLYPDMAADSDTEETDLALERALGIEADTPAEFFSAVVLHENRPVAIMEQLYDLFCYCHVRAGHGGRDKTCAVIRQHYSWVPKELTAQFVKACPTCALKRSGHGGVDMGVLVQRRVVGQRERRVRGTPLGAEGVPVPVVPSSLGSVGWPTTGGPLDPANPEPCGVRKRERERAWLRAHEDAKTIDPLSLPTSGSPARASVDASARTRSVPSQAPLEGCLPSEWNGVPRVLTADTSPFRLCGTTDRSVVGTTGYPQPDPAGHENDRTRIRSDRVEKRVPTRAGLPSLASALSNGSLDENVNLTGLGPETAGECLPPVLRPLRLSGPIPSDTEPDLPLPSPPPPPPSESYLFQIDPVLLSFNYPGLDHTSESGPTSDYAIPLALSPEARLTSLEDQRGQGDTVDMCHCVTNGDVAGTGVYRLPTRRVPSNCIDVECLNTPRRGTLDVDDRECELGRDALDAQRFEHGHGAASYYTGSTRRCGPGSRYGRRGGPLALLYPSCSVDDSDSVGQDLDGTFSFSIMTDA